MKDTMIGVDLAKNVFQLHGASMTGEVKFRKKLARPQFMAFMAEHPASVVVMEACGRARTQRPSCEALTGSCNCPLGSMLCMRLPGNRWLSGV